jgi:tetratricopeptide (TPR) repeat protein
MFCPGCGEKNDDTSACCNKCGIDLARLRVVISEGKQDPRGKGNQGAFPDDVNLSTDSPETARVISDPGIADIKEGSPSGSPVFDSSDPVKLKERGNELFRQEKFLDALDCYEKALAIDQFYKEAWYNKSIVLKKIGYQDQSKVCWGIYKRLNSGDPENRENKL